MTGDQGTLGVPLGTADPSTGQNKTFYTVSTNFMLESLRFIKKNDVLCFILFYKGISPLSLIIKESDIVLFTERPRSHNGRVLHGFLQTSVPVGQAHVLGCSGAGTQGLEPLGCALGSQIALYLKPTPILSTPFHRVFIRRPAPCFPVS